jgi:membrane-associated phospholipid phosphatase
MAIAEIQKSDSSVLSDLRLLGYDFLRVYPRSFMWITAHWKFSLLFVFILFSSFYLDAAFRDLVLGLRRPSLDLPMDFGRWYGSWAPTLYVFVILYVLGLIIRNYTIRNLSLLIFEAYIYSGFVTVIFKSLFGRWRPFTAHGVLSFSWLELQNEQLSFVSGHASVGFALSCVLASTTGNVYLKSFFYLLAVVTALSRVYHDQHWLSDIVMGSFIGILFSTQLIQMHKERHAA